MKCPVTDLAHILGRKWSVPLLEEIAVGKFDGFNSFMARSKLTPHMLSLQLKEFERGGLISKSKRKDSNRTEYELTGRGKDAHRLVLDMKKLCVKWSVISGCGE